ncbi:vitamin B12 ABC transporter substrate-binding protein BtuF [Vibrio aquaticus]|uniref:Vitamin B12-binding protein n=1 Tax=Vibrio aquaticus TaxID=2496559 RepID=A0A3S0Q1R1_9VIBR|nr:vitamin B12 ABC transporter substrate-binding protein BtuF [Vibrio aquaticus]RTZ15974.1 vitamin B12 ABC transporter substrate-binding protein BtuF [Vibrio aquaticus]
MRSIAAVFSILMSFYLYSAPVERVISLAPHATEIAYAAGLGDKLVAVSERSDYPEQAQSIEKVSNYQGIKLERIIALQPDLIIAWPSGNPAGELKKLEQFGFNIYYSHTNSLDDIANNIEQLSQYSSEPNIGKRAADDFRQSLVELKARYHTEQSVRYFYQLSQQPIITLAQGKWPSEVFDFCGGENTFEKSAAPYPQVGLEQVIVQNPDVIFTSAHALANGNMWEQWHDQLNAVQNDAIWSLNSDWINRPTPRTLKAIEQVCEYFETVRQKR